MNHTFPALIILATLLLAGNDVAAQKKRKYYMPPKAILVQLSTETNRMAWLLKNKNELSVTQLQQDVQAVIEKTVTDFSDNFYYCPVYFFMDTNAAQVRAGRLGGVLLDKDLQPVKNMVLNDGDTNFFIGYYGPRTSDFSGKDETEYYRYHNDMDTHIPRWVMLDRNFHALRAPLPYSFGVRRAPYGRALKQPYKTYVYNSPKFNIAYAPSALLYAATLEDFYKRHRKRRK